MPISCGISTEETEVQTLEERYNIYLPEDYRDFLRVKNGFVVKTPDFVELEYAGVDEGVIAFYALFGLGTQNLNHDIFYHNDERLIELSFINDKLIIGDDPGGNYFILLNGRNKKGIFYWDRTHLHAEDEIQDFEISEYKECGNIYKICDSFALFFESVSAKTISNGMQVIKDLSKRCS